MRVMLAVCGVVTITLAATAGSLPGWRPPRAAEVDQAWRKDNPNRYVWIAADFDGDGHADRAELLVRDPAPGVALVVTLARDTRHPLVLEQSTDVAWLDAMGVDVASPGEYKTACGKGYSECQPGEPESLKLGTPAIEFFKVESASSFFVFEPARGRFKRVWISD